jgi:GntR family transcriptional regulator
MFWKPNPSSGIPIYLQLVDQVKHAIETGALRPDEQLPGIRKVAGDLVVNVNTVAKAYRELEHEGVIELRQGFGAFVAGNSAESGAQRKFLRALPAMRTAVNRIAQLGLDEQQMRRLFETELTRLRKGSQHD